MEEVHRATFMRLRRADKSSLGIHTHYQEARSITPLYEHHRWDLRYCFTHLRFPTPTPPPRVAVSATAFSWGFKLIDMQKM